MTVLSSFPAVLGLLVLVAMLVWLAVAARGRPRVLALAGVGLELLAVLVGVVLGALLPTLRATFGLSMSISVLLFSGTSTLLSSAGIVLLVLAVVTATRTAPTPR